MIEQLRNCGALASWGLTVEFPKSKFGGLTVDDSRVIWDQALINNAWRAFAGQLKSKLGSMLSLVYGMPHATAPLVGGSAADRQETLDYLKDAYTAVAVARERGSAVSLELVRCPGTDSPLMEWTGRVLESVDFASVPRLLADTLDELWSSINLDKYEEDKLKFIRERETRSSNHKQVSCCEAWHAPTHHKLMQDYKREEVQRISSAPLPPQFDLGSVFKIGDLKSRNDAETLAVTLATPLAVLQLFVIIQKCIRCCVWLNAVIVPACIYH